MAKRASEEEILGWVRAKDWASFGNHLVSGVVHGKPGLPVGELGRIEKILAKILDRAELYAAASALLKRPEYSARCMGLAFVHLGWPKPAVEKQVAAAADDEDWIVRECAASAFARLLALDFPYFSKKFAVWTKSSSVNVKRAIALAVKYESKSADPAKWKTYLRLIDPLMSEEAEYIRKNLGPFAIGDGLLSRYPEKILAECRRWSRGSDVNMRWNTAMIFTAAHARKFGKEGRAILKPLLADESPFVARAAKKAERNLTRS
jgi:hypothetical protein